MRVALVGCGFGAAHHMKAISTYNNAQVVGIADIGQDRLKQFGKKYGIGAQFSNFEEMIDKTRPDVVHVITPPLTHAAIATKILEMGCAVLVEKPMCMDEREADRIIEAAKSNGKPLCVMHNHLYDPPVQKAKDLIRSKPGNDPYLVKITYLLEHGKLVEEGCLDPGHWIHKLPLGFYGEHAAPHVLYLLLNWVKEVSDVNISEMTCNYRESGVSRLWNVTLKSRTCMGVMTLGDHTSLGQFVIELFTPLMVIRLNMLNLTWSIYRERNIGLTAGRILGSVEESGWWIWNTAKNMILIAAGRLKRRPGHRGLIRAFYDSLQNGQPPPVSGEEGREVVRILRVIEKTINAQLGTK